MANTITGNPVFVRYLIAFIDVRNQGQVSVTAAQLRDFEARDISILPAFSRQFQRSSDTKRYLITESLVQLKGLGSNVNSTVMAAYM